VRGVKKNIMDNNKCRPMYLSKACIHTHTHTRTYTHIYIYTRIIIIIIVSFHTFWKTLKTTGVREYYIRTTRFFNIFFSLFCLPFILPVTPINPSAGKTHKHTNTAKQPPTRTRPVVRDYRV